MHFGFRAPHGWVDLPENTHALRDAGFDWMEVDAPEVGTSELLTGLRRVAADNGFHLSVHAHFVDVNLSSSNATVRQNAIDIVQRDIAFAAEIGAELVVAHPGDIGWFDFLPAAHPDYAEAQRVIDQLRLQCTTNALDSLTRCGGYAADRGVRLVFENMYCPWDVLVTPEDVSEAFRRERLDNVGFILDFGHSRVAGRTPEEYVRALGGRIWHTHLHQNDGLYDVHRPLAAACTYGPALKALAESNPDVTLLIELPPRSLDEYLTGLRIVKGLLA
ncbi:MAG: sugar phosphate isomerase/epimerase family protein [Symbiobacteriia bacterium]